MTWDKLKMLSWIKRFKTSKWLLPIYVGLLTFTFISCYTFSGSSISPNWQTIKIATFPNFAPLQNPNLSQEFTDKLQDIFSQRTKLELTTSDNADLLIEGEITGYQQSSVAIQANEIAGKNRLTITVRVRYQNNKDEDKSFDKTYSAFEDFDGNLTLQQVESELTIGISEQIINLIFNDIAMDW